MLPNPACRFILVAPPVSFNPGRFASAYMLGDCSFFECLDFDASQPSRVHLIPRKPGGGAAKVGPMQMHLGWVWQSAPGRHEMQ